jgi:hypothetical protein
MALRERQKFHLPLKYQNECGFCRKRQPAVRNFAIPHQVFLSKMPKIPTTHLSLGIYFSFFAEFSLMRKFRSKRGKQMMLNAV